MAAKHLSKGRRGEEIAEKTLLNQGYRIIARNWRHRQLEVDFVAEDEGTLVFVEVKTRNEISFGQPYEAVDRQKERLLARAANAYIRQHRHRGEIRFDIVSVVFSEDLPGGMSLRPEIRLIKDAFWPG